ncbi:helix-turn-helix domain-containing protein [Hymenobacter jeollabukensis]|uniref:Helix-turn-helix domain-containing protein n=1 Tax=Hymenobacter jeollabukensis TaxID=2025313 RepID=A0A5R8WLK9_9BACT|nr:AraC family transcriptional regulator [Hymenobacter jeollabukensis]TLM90055.1 helix-turn-helix domain-containing protein [Hymenobacter jeollabukensis]
MKPTAPPVLALTSFPPSAGPRPYYVAGLAEHLARFPHVREPHAHDFYLLIYVTEGAGLHTIDQVTYELRPGSLFFLAPGQVHHWQLPPEVQGYVVFFSAEFYLFRYPGPRLYEYPFFAGVHPPVLYLPPTETELLGLLQRLHAETRAEPPQQAEVVRAYLLLLLELAARHVAAPATGAAALAQQQIRQFGALLNQHYRQQRTVQQYADMLHLTANHLNAVCRRVLNKTASALIHERVVVEAQRLLAHSALSVAQVADELGFDDPSYFGRYFRKYAGLPPEAYRQQHR